MSTLLMVSTYFLKERDLEIPGEKYTLVYILDLAKCASLRFAMNR